MSAEAFDKLAGVFPAAPAVSSGRMFGIRGTALIVSTIEPLSGQSGFM
jgi:hypothetical protein